MRASGILLPVSSLPSPYGIGAFSKEAYRFIDFLVKAGQKNWQILPLGPTGYGDSPYQSFSTFAGNPYFIDPEALISEGVLQQSEIEEYDFGDNPQYVDYEKIYKSRFKLLRKAFDRSYIAEDAEFLRYREENSFWLDDYSLYMAVKDHFEGISWIEWDEDIRLRKTEAMNKYKEKLETEILFYQYMQFLFSSQWAKLKRYANDRGIRIIGDIPIYVAFDSSDSWAHTELFQFDENRKPIAVAGCPPDGFSATGQLWGNPLYNWEYHKQTGYEWWIKRIDYCFKLYDVLRVDHFRGFDEYYAIPFGNETAQYGQWMKGPGLEFFRTLNQKLGERDIIAEDLGFLTPSVLQLVKDTGYPGMKVLEFAFDSREDSDYLPHNYEKNCVVYTGTHDNQTLKSWFDELTDWDREFAVEYMHLENVKKEDIPMEIVRVALASVANLAVIPMQDYLGRDQAARINTPSTLGDNWKWRLTGEELSDGLAAEINRLTRLYSR